MKRMTHTLLAVALVSALSFTPAAYVIGQSSLLTVHAHGSHHGEHHSESNTDYYYCDGHDAHLHENGSCPYADSAPVQDSPGADYYYCDGHDAHLHENGSCPYADSAPAQDSSGADYYYCDGHDAHLHENGSCPYADSAPVQDNSGNVTGAKMLPGKHYGRHISRHGYCLTSVK